MGNLAAAFRTNAELGEIATRRAKSHPYFAELREGHQMAWHVAQTYPGHEVRAIVHLAARRIGAYLPMVLVQRMSAEEETERRVKGIRVGNRWVQRPMFPEYIFMLISDIAAHRARIRGTPGISSIVMDGDREAVLPDEWIVRLQRKELAYMFGTGEINRIATKQGVEIADPVGKRKGQRHGKRGPKEPEGPHIVSMACKSHWTSEMDRIEDLDDEARVGLLHQVLGLSATSSDAVPRKPQRA